MFVSLFPFFIALFLFLVLLHCIGTPVQCKCGMRGSFWGFFEIQFTKFSQNKGHYFKVSNSLFFFNIFTRLYSHQHYPVLE